MKTKVYSWRLSPDRKAALDEVAKREGKTIAHLLEEATDDLLTARDSAGDDEQTRLHARVSRHVGTLTGGEAASTGVRALVRERLAEKRRKGRL